MDSSKTPRALTGALVGLALGGPLLAALFVADQAAGLPFLPFDLFALVRDALPGNIITGGIDAMVDVILALNLGRVDTTAKIIEEIMGLGLVLLVTGALGALTFAVLRGVEHERRAVSALGLGFAAGLLMAFISLETNVTASASVTAGFVWLVIVFVALGGALAWTHARLAAAQTDAQTASVEVLSDDDGMDRRSFLIRFGGATATLTIVGAGLGSLLDRRAPVETVSLSAADPEATPDVSAALPPDLPNAGAAVQPAPGTRAEYTPLGEHYRIDINVRPPNVDGASWVLPITGMVAQPLEITLDDLVNNYEPVDQFVTLSCISNPIAGELIGTTRWTGVPLRTLMQDWGVSPSARYMHITAADNFDEYLSVSLARQDERVMLTYAWDGQPLTQGHGFPLRIYIPDRYGMKQPKWITGIEFMDTSDEGYWVRRGWSELALVRTVSVIDTVATEHAFERDGQTFIPIGGIAYSGAKGISRVEVQINDDDWTEAELRDPLSETTWVIWRYDWPFAPGNHTFRVRCYDAAGNMQITDSNPVRPDGATGVHTMRREIVADAQA